MKKFLALILIGVTFGCANPWVKMESYFVNEETRIKPSEGYEKTVAEAASFHLYKRKELTVPEMVRNFPEFLVRNPLPPLWIRLLWQGPDRWEFRPLDDNHLAGIIIFRKEIKNGQKEELRAKIKDEEMVHLARLLITDGDYTYFLKKYDPKYKYDKIHAAAEYVRKELIRDILTSSAPADIGDPMVPILIEAAEKGHYPRHCVQSLQIITGQFFGYPPEFIDLLAPEDIFLFRNRHREAIKKWRKWYETTRNNGKNNNKKPK